MYIQTENTRGILIKIKLFFFQISKDFIMNKETFLFQFYFYLFIRSINVGIFNLFQEYGLIYVFIHVTKDFQFRNEIHLPNNLNRFYILFH